MEELARLTKNFSGAEIEGLVKSAASYAFARGIEGTNLEKAPDPKDLVVQWEVRANLKSAPRTCFRTRSNVRRICWIFVFVSVSSFCSPVEVLPDLDATHRTRVSPCGGFALGSPERLL